MNSLEQKMDTRNNSSIFFFIITLLIAGSVYLYTLAPTVTFGDSGDFITAVNTFRFAHPPGYPTYIVTGKLFSWLPIPGNLAYRINFMSGFFSVLAVGLVYLLILSFIRGGKPVFRKEVAESPEEDTLVLDWGICACAMLGALCFAFSGTFWSQALVAKVHPLAAFLTGLMVFWVYKYGKTGNLKYWYASVFIWGISLGNHHTPILYVIPVLLYLAYEKKMKTVLSGAPLLFGIGFSFLGFCFNLLIPLVSAQLIEVEWGWGNTWEGFKNILLRGDYAPYEWGRTFSALTEQISTAAMMLITGQSTSIIGLLYGLLITCMGLLGVVWFIKNKKREGILLVGIAALVWGFYIANSNHPMTRQLSLETRDIFFIPGYMIFGILVGLGATGAYEKIFLDEESHLKNPKTAKLTWIIIFFFLAGIGLSVQFHRRNEREYFLARDYARCLLDTMEKDALYVGDDDMHLFPLWYLQQVEGYRTDALILSRTSFYKQWYYDNLEKRNIPQFHLPPFRESMVPKDIMLAQAFLDKQLFALYAMNLAERPCYFYQKYPLRINPPLRVTRVGLLYRVSLTPFENTIQTEDYPYIPSPVSYQYQLGLQPQGERDFWRNWAVERLSDYHDLEGRYWMAQLNMDNAEANFLQSIDLNPFNAEGHYDLGMYYLSTGNNQQARDSFGRALYINPQMEKARKEIQKL